MPTIDLDPPSPSSPSTTGAVAPGPPTSSLPPPPAPPTQPPPRHRGRRVVATVLVIGLLGAATVVGTPVVLYLRRSHPQAKSVGSAVQGFRATTTTTDGAGRRFAGPRAGVYQATGSGTEQISVPPNSQHDGAVMPITVTSLPNGCWRWHLDYDTAHWHEYDFCNIDGSLLLVAQRNFQRWDFGAATVTNLGTYTCSPPAPVVQAGARVGQQFEHRCTGTNSAAPGTSLVDGPATMAGTTTLDIGGQRVPALRQTRVEHLSGSQTGTVTEQWWFDARTGLPLRAERSYRITSPSPIGDVTYTEHGWWQLRSLHATT